MTDAGERQIGQKLEEIESKHVERYRFTSKYCRGKGVLDAARAVFIELILLESY